MCPPLGNPTNGAVVVGGLTVGSNAGYICDAGYELSGSGLRICESSGEWSGSEPSCEQGTLKPLCEPGSLSSVLYKTIINPWCVCVMKITVFLCVSVYVSNLISRVIRCKE